MENKQHIIFFDGVCNLCNSSVRTIIKKDRNNIFRFASLQSDFAKTFFSSKNFKPDSDSIVYWCSEVFYTQSTAVLKISRHLKFPAPALQIFLIVPKFIRDAIYDMVAKHRYKWFGRREQCMLPTAELKERFYN